MATEPLELWTRQTETLAPESVETDEAKGFGKPQPSCADRDLQLSRRLDWRFLLPNPYLGRVAYLGSPGGTLPRALRAFSHSLKMVSPSTPTVHALNNQPIFDLVVLHSRGQAEAEKASSILTAGGLLYWEIEPANWLSALHRVVRREREEKRWSLHLNLIRDFIVFLQQLGFSDIEAHWHRPSFERCSAIIPLHDDLALDYIFSRNHDGFIARLQLTTQWWMIKTGLLPHLLPCISLIAFKRWQSF